MPMERYTSTTSMPYYVYTHSFKELAVPVQCRGYALPSGPLVRKKIEVRTGTRERCGPSRGLPHDGAHL